MIYVLFLAALLCFPLLTRAEDGVCGDTTVMTRYILSTDPSKMPATVGGKACVAISKADTPAQRALVQAIPAHHLKVVGGLAVEMTQGEKDAVDAARAATAAAHQVFIDQLTNDTLCNFSTLAQVTSRLATRRATLQTQIAARQAAVQAQIDALAAANLTTLKAALTALNTELYETAIPNAVDELYAVVEKTTQCLLAARRTRQ
jgi:hypothetical protein